MWIEIIAEAVRDMENRLTEDINVESVALNAHTSASHFQFLFHAVTGITIGEYLRNRRLTLAGRELLLPGAKLIDIALRYGYDSQESFSKAFARFHGVPPSKASEKNLKQFHPLTIEVNIRGGFQMAYPFADDFSMIDWRDFQADADAAPEAKYAKLTAWARKARGQNPSVFDEVTEWLKDDAQWTESALAENEQILMRGILPRFQAQNAKLRACLARLAPTGVVNDAVFQALDAFDAELRGDTHNEELRKAVCAMFADFSCMASRETREIIAGGKTGPTGTNGVPFFGYINVLSDADSQVHWALFMPELVKQQQNGFAMSAFCYKKMPPMRFLGMEGEAFENPEARDKLFEALDALREYASDFPYDLLFMHHNGQSVDTGAWHGVWGRFMRADAPVPEGFQHFDLVPEDDGQTGAPYLSQFAMATFTGSAKALHRREGYDCDAMYDVTRNAILGQGVTIPYPRKYWTCEVMRSGHRESGDTYLFSVQR